MNIEKIIEVLDKTYRIINIVFIKRSDNSEREMICKTKILNYKSKNKPVYNMSEKNLYPVIDIENDNKIKAIPLDRIVSITYCGFIATTDRNLNSILDLMEEKKVP